LFINYFQPQLCYDTISTRTTPDKGPGCVATRDYIGRNKDTDKNKPVTEADKQWQQAIFKVPAGTKQVWSEPQIHCEPSIKVYTPMKESTDHTSAVCGSSCVQFLSHIHQHTLSLVNISAVSPDMRATLSLVATPDSLILVLQKGF
jgi:hypothetical protein